MSMLTPDNLLAILIVDQLDFSDNWLMLLNISILFTDLLLIPILLLDMAVK